MVNAQQRKQYLKTKIQTASPEQLVLMLYDGALRFCSQGIEALEHKEIEAAHIALTRCQNIILELIYSLDREKGGEIAVNLNNLYAYCLQRLVEANVHHDTARAREVIKIIRNIRDGWAGAMEKLKNGDASVEDVPQPETAQPQAFETVTAATEATAVSASPESLSDVKPAAAPARRSTGVYGKKLSVLAGDAPLRQQPRLSVQG